jgi:hypothetical protein
VYAELLQERSTAGRRPPPEPLDYGALIQWARAEGARGLAQKAWSYSKRNFQDQLRTLGHHQHALIARKSLSDKSQYIGGVLLKGASRWTGSAVGFQLPELDVRFEGPGGALVFHSAPRLLVEVTLEWLKRLVVICQEAADLQTEDRRVLETLSACIGNAQTGVQQGILTRDRVWGALPILRKYLHREQAVPIDREALGQLDAILEQMQRAAQSDGGAAPKDPRSHE